MDIQKYKTMKRIKEEYEYLEINPLIICESNTCASVGLVNEDDIFEWKVTLTGPRDTSYKSGVFSLRIKFSEDYPEQPPDVYFKTPIYHLNINPIKISMKGAGSLGHIYMNILNCWKPENKIIEVLKQINDLLHSPDLDSPYGLEKVEEFKYDRAIYEAKVEYFTKKYASRHNTQLEYDTDWDFSFS